MSGKRIYYFDNNATTMIAPEVLDAMMPVLTDFYGNAGGMYSFAAESAHRIDKARGQVAELLNAHEDEIIFTSCGTESDATAWLSATVSQPNKKHVITTKVEHAAVLAAASQCEANGYRVTYLDVDEYGRLNLDQLKNEIGDDTALVSIMFANNETGTVNDIETIAQIVKEKGVLLHVDAVQAAGKLPIDLQKLPIDYLAISGHKLHAPKGIGIMYARRGAKYHSLIRGGHQENGRRAGTENVPYIVAIGMACYLAKEHMQEENTRVPALRDKLQNTLLASIPQSKLNGDKDHRLPNTLNISYKNVEGEAILLSMDRYGICAGSGSACTSASLEPSHVLRAMGVPFQFAHGSIRYSLSRYTTEEEVDFVISKMPQIIADLRELSPFKD